MSQAAPRKKPVAAPQPHPRSAADAQQRRHWERLGQIMRSMKLIEYQLTKPGIPMKVAQALNSARSSLWAAYAWESRNNEFIHLNLTPEWRK